MAFIVYITTPGADMQVAETPPDFNYSMPNARSKFIAATAGLPLGTASIYSAPFAQSADEALQTARDAGFRHRDDAPATTQAEMEENFYFLTRTTWSGIFTKRIVFVREENMVHATFGDYQDAVMFARGYLDQTLETGSDAVIRLRETVASEEVRGIISDDCRRRQSMSDRIYIPERTKAMEPVTIIIPLDILDPVNLRKLVAYEPENRPAPERR